MQITNKIIRYNLHVKLIDSGINVYSNEVVNIWHVYNNEVDTGIQLQVLHAIVKQVITLLMRILVMNVLTALWHDCACGLQVVYTSDFT